MTARIHGKNPANLPRVEAAFRAQHRDDAITVQQNETGWSITCGWQHVAPDMRCVPERGRNDHPWVTSVRYP